MAWSRDWNNDGILVDGNERANGARSGLIPRKREVSEEKEEEEKFAFALRLIDG